MASYDDLDVLVALEKRRLTKWEQEAQQKIYDNPLLSDLLLRLATPSQALEMHANLSKLYGKERFDRQAYLRRTVIIQQTSLYAQQHRFDIALVPSDKPETVSHICAVGSLYRLEALVSYVGRPMIRRHAFGVSSIYTREKLRLMGFAKSMAQLILRDPEELGIRNPLNKAVYQLTAGAVLFGWSTDPAIWRRLAKPADTPDCCIRVSFVGNHTYPIPNVPPTFVEPPNMNLLTQKDVNDVVELEREMLLRQWEGRTFEGYENHVILLPSPGLIQARLVHEILSAAQLGHPSPTYFGIECGERGTEDWSFLIWHSCIADQFLKILVYRIAKPDHLLALTRAVASFAPLQAFNLQYMQLSNIKPGVARAAGYIPINHFSPYTPFMRLPIPEWNGRGSITWHNCQDYADDYLKL